MPSGETKTAKLSCTITGTRTKIISKAERKCSRATKCKSDPPELSIFLLSSRINASVKELLVCIYHIVTIQVRCFMAHRVAHREFTEMWTSVQCYAKHGVMIMLIMYCWQRVNAERMTSWWSTPTIRRHQLMCISRRRRHQHWRLTRLQGQ